MGETQGIRTLQLNRLRAVQSLLSCCLKTMKKSDWFRHHSWSESDRADFFARLAKSRSSFHKAQYARIQAYELHESGGKKYAHAALQLLDLVLEKWQADDNLAVVHHQRAVCLQDIGDAAGTLNAYREAFEAQRRFPSFGTNAHVDFAWWVAISKKRKLFIEALTVLEKFSEDGLIVFPTELYQAEGARALILEKLGKRKQAATHAQNALDAAAMQHTGLRYHPKLGLVKIKNKKVHKTLQRIAGVPSRRVAKDS